MNGREIAFIEKAFIKSHVQAIHHVSHLLLADIGTLNSSDDSSPEHREALVNMLQHLNELRDSYFAVQRHVSQNINKELKENE